MCPPQMRQQTYSKIKIPNKSLKIRICSTLGAQGRKIIEKWSPHETPFRDKNASKSQTKIHVGLQLGLRPSQMLPNPYVGIQNTTFLLYILRPNACGNLMVMFHQSVTSLCGNLMISPSHPGCRHGGGYAQQIIRTTNLQFTGH